MTSQHTSSADFPMLKETKPQPKRIEKIYCHDCGFFGYGVKGSHVCEKRKTKC